MQMPFPELESLKSPPATIGAGMISTAHHGLISDKKLKKHPDWHFLHHAGVGMHN